MVADTLRMFADKLEVATDKQRAMEELIGNTYKEHQRIIFNGNNYSTQWEQEAKTRGLEDLPNMVSAVPAFIRQKNIDMFTRTKVFTANECHSRFEVMLEHYINTINIDANTMLEMVKRSIIPAVYEYLGIVAKATQRTRDCGVACKSSQKLLEQLVASLDHADDCICSLEQSLSMISHDQTIEKKAGQYLDLAQIELSQLRVVIDALESIVAVKYWPIPSYSRLLYDL